MKLGGGGEGAATSEAAYQDYALGRGYVSQDQWRANAAASAAPAAPVAMAVVVVTGSAAATELAGTAVFRDAMVVINRSIGMTPRNMGNALTTAERKLLPSIWRGQNPISALSKSARNAAASVYEQTATILEQSEVVVAFQSCTSRLLARCW